MKTYLYVKGEKDPIQFDQTAEASMLAWAKRNDKPVYDVVSHCGVLLDRTANLASARKQIEKGDRCRLYERQRGRRVLMEEGTTKFPPEKLGALQ